MQEMEQRDKAVSDELHSKARREQQLVVSQLQAEHENKAVKAREEAARKMAAIEQECQQRLDDFVHRVEEEETKIQGAHASMLQAAEQEVAARLEELADECNSKVREMEQACESKLKQLVQEVEEQEARLQTCLEQVVKYTHTHTLTHAHTHTHTHSSLWS